MMDHFRKANVFVQNKLAGVLEETDMGYVFSYNEEYLRDDNPLAISLTMPLSEQSYQSTVLFPFFDGLIPEGWMLEMIHQKWKIDMRDRFGLLLVSCRDSVGDVYIEETE